MTRTKTSVSRTWSSSAIHVIDEGIIGQRVSEIVSKMRAGLGRPDPKDTGKHTQSARRLALGTGEAVGGLRTYLPEEIGNGYWDFIEVCPGVFVSVTDAVYHRQYRMVLPAEALVKFRVVCSGSLVMARQDLTVSDGAVLVQRVGGGAPAEYLVDGAGSPLRMVVLHALPEALPGLGITEEALPVELRRFLHAGTSSDAVYPVESSAKLLRIAKDILDSRDRLVSEMRLSYIRGKAYELLCEIALWVGPVADRRSGRNRFRHSDVIRLQEAKRILASDLEASPTIDQLSRLVGINRTKLKAGFREVFGVTVQEYRMRVRMAEARRLIEETDLPMAEIGRRVGFSHAANFTQVIKRNFGMRPLELRKVGAPAAHRHARMEGGH